MLDKQITTLAALEAQSVYDDPHRGFGVAYADDSEGDSLRWCNFGTAGFVECGCAGAISSRVDNEEEEPVPTLSADVLSDFFECGRSYE